MPSSRRLTLAALAVLVFAGAVSAQATVALEQLSLSRGDEGLRLAYSARLELPRALDEALHKGVPLHFLAEARLLRARWYWRDAVVASDLRRWRLTYQPLTRQYRVSTGGLHQGYESLGAALLSIARATAWPLGLNEEVQAGAEYLLSFQLRLDSTQLPGPLQIGLGSGITALNLSREQRVTVAELLGPPP